VIGEIGEIGGPGELVAAVAGTDGSRWSILTLEAGGTRLPFHSVSQPGGAHKSIVMHGREVFREAVGRMTEAATKVLEKAGRALSEVALVVPHQANLRIISAVGKSLGVTMEKIYVNVQEYGNTGSASVPLALSEARDLGRIRPGDLVLLTSFGAGFHWAATLVQF